MLTIVPVGGSSLQSRHAALVWPYRAVERYNGPFNSTLKNKILVVTTEADPITPAPNAKKVADLLGDSAEYIEQKGAGVSLLEILMSSFVSLPVLILSTPLWLSDLHAWERFSNNTS